MANSRKSKPKPARSAAPSTARSLLELQPERLLSKPLEALVFLLPLILFYEIGCLFLQPADVGGASQDRVVAFHLLQLFFRLFGSTGVWMPGLAVIVILLCTHVASRQPWRIRQRTVAIMYLESVLLAVPLLMFNQLLRSTTACGPAEGSVWVDVVLGVGAGVYEELVFRLIFISLIVIVGTDLLRLPNSVTLGSAVVLSSLAFAAHHHPPLGSEPFSFDIFAFRALAGGYLAILFVCRGYGPAAGTHAAYNILVALA